jgi:type VI secretion system secreted protein Hcp
MTLVVLAVAGLATYSWAASPEAQTINACLNDEGKLRLVTAGTACKKGETPLSWNTVGPAGAQGAQGPAGPAGAQGPPGASAGDPSSVAGTMAITGKKQGSFGPIILSGVSHEIVSPRDAASGLPTGKRQHKPITIVKEWGASTPLLLNALTTNESLTSVLIGLLRNGTQVATIKLTNASVSSYVSHGLTESWSFTYQKIEWTWVDGGITAQDDWEAPVA